MFCRKSAQGTRCPHGATAPDTRTETSPAIRGERAPVAVWWQNGVPQPMQRAACVVSRSLNSSPSSRATTSPQSFTRSPTGRYGSGDLPGEAAAHPFSIVSHLVERG